MLCDAHLHFMPKAVGQYTSFYHGVWQDESALTNFLEENNIDKALLTYPTCDAYKRLRGFAEVSRLYNDAIEELAAKNKKIIPCAIFDWSQSTLIEEHLKEIIDRGFKAISIPSSYEGKFMVDPLWRFFEICEKNDLVVFVHPQTVNPIGFDRVDDPLLMPVLEYSFDISMCLGLYMMQGVLERFKIKFIFSSLAGVTPFLKDRFDRVYPMLKQRGMVGDLGKMPSEIFKKVYVDSSGSSLTNIKLAIDLFGSDKILWGSDYPVNPKIKDNLAILDILGEDLKRKITHENFISVFK